MKREEIVKILDTYFEATSTKLGLIADQILSLSPTDINVGSKGEEALTVQQALRDESLIPYLKSEADHQIPRMTKILGTKPSMIEQGVNALLAIVEGKLFLKEPSLTAEGIRQNNKRLAEEILDRCVDKPYQKDRDSESYAALYDSIIEAMEEYSALRKVEMPQPEVKPETAQQYYDRLRKQGWTDDITSNEDPDYRSEFYQNIFRLMEGYSLLKSK